MQMPRNARTFRLIVSMFKDKPEELLEFIETNSLEGFELNTQAMNNLLEVLSQHGKTEAAEKYYDKMIKRPIPVDENTHILLASAFLKDNNLDKSSIYFAKIQKGERGKLTQQNLELFEYVKKALQK